jgi:peptidoglycan/LPS O-acetylase OafA/YrhL
LRVLADGSALERIFVMASNTFIFGLDLNHFMHVTPSGSIAIGYGEPSAAYLALIGPSWSLGVELGFYLLAPFLLVRRTRTLVVVVGASIAFRVAVSFVDPHAVYGFSETWNGVLPSELATFLVGALGYRFYQASDRVALARIGPLMLVLIALYVLFYTRMGERFPRLMIPYFGFVALTALALPFVFSWTRDRAIDRFVGELSYPVYLSHGLILATLTYQFGMAGGSRVIAAIAVSIVLAAALVVALERPLQRFRNARFVERRPPHSIRAAPVAAAGEA